MFTLVPFPFIQHKKTVNTVDCAANAVIYELSLCDSESIAPDELNKVSQSISEMQEKHIAVIDFCTTNGCMVRCFYGDEPALLDSFALSVYPYSYNYRTHSTEKGIDTAAAVIGTLLNISGRNSRYRFVSVSSESIAIDLATCFDSYKNTITYQCANGFTVYCTAKPTDNSEGKQFTIASEWNNSKAFTASQCAKHINDYALSSMLFNKQTIPMDSEKAIASLVDKCVADKTDMRFRLANDGVLCVSGCDCLADSLNRYYRCYKISYCEE